MSPKDRTVVLIVAAVLVAAGIGYTWFYMNDEKEGTFSPAGTWTAAGAEEIDADGTFAVTETVRTLTVDTAADGVFSGTYDGHRITGAYNGHVLDFSTNLDGGEWLLFQGFFRDGTLQAQLAVKSNAGGSDVMQYAAAALFTRDGGTAAAWDTIADVPTEWPYFSGTVFCDDKFTDATLSTLSLAQSGTHNELLYGQETLTDGTVIEVWGILQSTPAGLPTGFLFTCGALGFECDHITVDTAKGVIRYCGSDDGNYTNPLAIRGYFALDRGTAVTEELPEGTAAFCGQLTLSDSGTVTTAAVSMQIFRDSAADQFFTATMYDAEGTLLYTFVGAFEYLDDSTCLLWATSDDLDGGGLRMFGTYSPENGWSVGGFYFKELSFHAELHDPVTV